jgi:outer membrane biosynthesis protein TonB
MLADSTLAISHSIYESLVPQVDTRSIVTDAVAEEQATESIEALLIGVMATEVATEAHRKASEVRLKELEESVMKAEVEMVETENSMFVMEEAIGD